MINPNDFSFDGIFSEKDHHSLTENVTEQKKKLKNMFAGSEKYPFFALRFEKVTWNSYKHGTYLRYYRKKNDGWKQSFSLKY